MHRKKNQCLFLMMFLCLSLLYACGGKGEEDAPAVVYRFGKKPVTYAEFFIYAKTVEEDYQKIYGNGIWSLELSTDNGKSTVKDVTIRDLVFDMNRVKVLAAHAEEMKIVLSDNEQEEAKEKAEQFYTGLTEMDLEQTEITKEIVVQVIKENMLAKKVYDAKISEYDFEISEEEARMTTFYDMVFETYSVKEDGTVEEFTSEKKATQLERANEALSRLAQSEDVTYEDIVEKYHLDYSETYTMSKTEMIEEYGETIASRLLALIDGEVSVVTESKYGYHIFKMIKSNDEELTKKNKQEIITKKQKEYFNSIYEEWLKKYDNQFEYEHDVDMTVIGRFDFSE